MRFFPIVLLAFLAFVVVTDGIGCGPLGRFCDDSHSYFAGSAGAIVDKEGMRRKCEVNDDCRHNKMELEVPRCTNGYCNNYTPKRHGIP